MVLELAEGVLVAHGRLPLALLVEIDSNASGRRGEVSSAPVMCAPAHGADGARPDGAGSSRWLPLSSEVGKADIGARPRAAEAVHYAVGVSHASLGAECARQTVQ